MKLVHRGATIFEVPVVLDTFRRAGRSKMSILRTIRGYLTIMGDRRRWCLPENRRPLSMLPADGGAE